MEKKDLIYNAALKVFSKYGYDNTKINMIAEEAQVAVGTIYLYFNSKEALLENIVCCEYQKRLDFLDHLDKCLKPADDKIRDYLSFHLDSLINNTDAGKILFNLYLSADIFLNDNINDIINKVRGRLCGLIQNAQERGTIRKTDPRLLNLIIFSSMKGFLNSLQQPKYDACDNSELKKQALDFIMKGLMTD